MTMPEAKRDEVPLPEQARQTVDDLMRMAAEMAGEFATMLEVPPAFRDKYAAQFDAASAKLRAALESTAAELEALRKDAARYRRLRAGIARTTGSPRAGRIEVFRWVNRCEGEQLKGEALDAAVDAALTQGGK